MEELVDNPKSAMAARIHKLSWMSEPTKAQAEEKLLRMKVMVGCPIKWRDYSKLKIDPKDIYGNVKRAIAFNFAFMLGKAGKPVDREEWGMMPQAVDCYSSALENKIVFPAGYLQPPFFGS